MLDLLDIKIDVVFKEFFGDRSSKDILESFINAVLGFEGDDRIEVEEFLDPRKMRIEVGLPTTFVDLLVKANSGERYIIMKTASMSNVIIWLYCLSMRERGWKEGCNKAWKRGLSKESKKESKKESRKVWSKVREVKS